MQQYFQHMVLIQTLKWATINDFRNWLAIYVFGDLAEALPAIDNHISYIIINNMLSIMQLQHVNDVPFYELNTSLYYIVTYVNGYLLNHYLHQAEYLYDFIIVLITTIHYLQRLNSAIKTQWSILNFDYIGHVFNVHVSLRADISKALFILIPQNKIIVIIMVIITQENTDIIKVTIFVVQQVQVIKDMVKKKKKKNCFFLQHIY